MSHDVVALQSVMQRYTCAEKKHAKIWVKAVTMLKNAELATCAEALRKIKSAKLTASKELEAQPWGGTGGPPHAKRKHEASPDQAKKKKKAGKNRKN